MEDQKIVLKCYCFPIIVVVFVINILLLMIKGSKSEEYIVGGEEQWNSQVDYGSWSQQYNFSVGDVLVFKYTKGQHNVYEVTRTTFQSCDSSSGVLARYESGNDQIRLTEARKYWFICNVVGHCFGGMRFTIDVKQSNSTSTSSGPSSTPPMLEPNNSCTRSGFHIWHIGMYIVASGLFFT